MKKSSSLSTTVLLAFIGAAAIQYVPISITASVAFLVGGLLCALPLYCYLSKCGDTNSTQVDESASQTLYVGNLPYRANENDVKELFTEHGEVFAVRLMKDKRTGKRRGFGFVVMDIDDAPNAIRQLNNSEYMDRTLKVREANDPKTQDSE